MKWPALISRNQILPALTLALITPFFTELLSGNTPAAVFFLPWVFIPLVLVYGLPLLIIREVFIKWNLSLSGLFILGLAYGIFNEGIIAKTLFRAENVPLNVFDHYVVLGVNWPWTFLIISWHALHSTIFPIALVAWAYPASREISWLTRRGLVGGIALASIVGVILFLKVKGGEASFDRLLFSTVSMGSLILGSRYAPITKDFLRPDGKARWLPVLAGFVFYPVFVLTPCLLAGLKAPGFMICLTIAVILITCFLVLSRTPGLTSPKFTLFALGDYLFIALFDLLTRHGPLINNITFSALSLFFLVALACVYRTAINPSASVNSPLLGAK